MTETKTISSILEDRKYYTSGKKDGREDNHADFDVSMKCYFCDNTSFDYVSLDSNTHASRVEINVYALCRKCGKSSKMTLEIDRREGVDI